MTPPPPSSSTRQLIRAGSPADVIATIWYRLGYRPSDSLVLLGLEGPNQRLGMCIRGNLPERDSPSAREALVAGMAAPLLATPTRRLLAVIFSDRSLGGGRPPITSAVLRREIARAGGELVETIGVTASRYRSLDCRGKRCCPTIGFPLSQVESSAAAAAHILVGQRVVATEAELIRDVEPVASVSQAQPVPGSHSARRERWKEWCQAFAAGELPSDRAALLAAALAHRPLRDAVLLAAFGGDPRVGEGMLSRPRPATEGPWAEAFAAFDAELAVSPEDDERAAQLEVARRVLAVAARQAAPGQRGQVLSLLAFLAWYQGSPARTRLLVQAALDDIPHESLALLIEQGLAAAVPPPWLPSPWAPRSRNGGDTVRGDQDHAG